jgi:hypothetical protein
VLKARPTCRAKEKVVTPSDLGLAGPKGERGPKGDAGATGPSWHVVDVYGNDAGAVVQMSDTGEVRVLKEMVLPDEDQPEPVETTLRVDGWNVLSGVSTILYLDTDCSGPQYLPAVRRFATELVAIQASGAPFH